MSVFSDNLGYLTDRYGLSFREVARRAQIPNAILSNVMHGVSNPRQATIAKIAAVFDMDAQKIQMVPLAPSAPVVNTADTPAPLFNMLLKLSREMAVKPTKSSRHLEPETLLDDAQREQLWRDACREASDGGDEALLTTYMPADDLAPAIPRGALLYITIETRPEHPTLLEDAPAIGILPLENGGKTLVFGYPSVSLGRITLKTSSGQSVTVDRVIAYVEGWTVFRRRRQT